MSDRIAVSKIMTTYFTELPIPNLGFKFIDAATEKDKLEKRSKPGQDIYNTTARKSFCEILWFNKKMPNVVTLKFADQINEDVESRTEGYQIISLPASIVLISFLGKDY